MRLRIAAIAATLAITGAVSGALTGCTHKQDDGNLLVYHGVDRDDVKTMDPANAYDVISLRMVPDVYETLYQYAYLDETFKPVPLLAADMPRFNVDKTEATIPIRHGIMFADDKAFKATHGKGRELTAQDFVYSWKRLALPSLQSQGWWIFDGRITGINAFHDKLAAVPRNDMMKIFPEKIEGMEAVDNYTIKLRMTKPYPDLLDVLCMTFTAAVPHEAVEAYADERGELNDHPVGTGPFILKEWKRGHRMVLDRNPNYHADFYPTEGGAAFRKKGLLADAGKPIPFIDRIDMTFIRERQPAWLGFMKGEFDTLELSKDNFAQAITNQVNLSPELASKGMRLSIETGMMFYYIAFNMKDKVLGNNKYLRQALSAAIDRDKWIDLFTSGTGRKMVNITPPGIPDRPKTVKIKYDYNPQLAKELLRKAGYPEGRGLPTLTFDLRGADSVNRQLGDFFQQEWGAIGVKVNVIPNTFPAYLEKTKQANFQISYGGWSMDYPNAENAYQLLWGGNAAPGPNETSWDNRDYNQWYQQITTMDSSPQRAALIQKMDDLAQEEVPWALGYYHAFYTLSQPWLLNYRGTDVVLNKHKYYKVNRDVKKRYLELK